MGDNIQDSSSSHHLPEFGQSNTSQTSLRQTENRENLLLPIANVGAIMRKILPSTAKISKEAKETMQESVSEFISFITNEASQRCQKEKRKTINGEDILRAMASLGLENYEKPLRIYLSKYRETEGDKLSSSNQRLKDQYCGSNMNNNLVAAQHYAHDQKPQALVGSARRRESDNLIFQPWKIQGNEAFMADPRPGGGHSYR